MTHPRIGPSLAFAVAAALASTASRAVDVQAGDWKFTFSGNVNAHYIYSSCEDEATAVAAGLACLTAAGEDHSSSISNGLLPAALSLSASTTQNGYDIGVTFGLYPGISTNDGGSPNLGAGPGSNTALGTASLDVRQVYLTFGNDRMGTFMFGRNIGLFQADAILFDMTLVGVGAGNGNYAAPFNTSLGSIGLGYIYTDWLAQMNYTTPDLSGVKITVGIFDPLEPTLIGAPTPKGAPGFHGKIAYTRGETLYLSASALYQEQEGVTDADDYDSYGFDLGGRVRYAGFEFMAYYYNGSGIGTTGLFLNSAAPGGNERDSDGFIAQITYSFGKEQRTKVGFNFGESNLDLASGELVSPLVESNSKFTIGLYHKLTENLTLVGEFSDINAEAHDGTENDSNNFNIGAFLSF